MRNQIPSPLRSIALPAALFAAAISIAAPLQATEAPALADTYVSTGFPSNNFGALGNVNIGGGNTGLLRFFITEVLPAQTVGRNVQKATLRLWVNKVNTAGSIGVFKAGSAWNEATVTQGTAPTLGAPVASTVAVSGTGLVLVDVTQAIRDWVNTPAQNFGLVLTASTGAPTTSVILDSRENTATSHAASIDITLGSADAGIVVRDANGNYLGTWNGGSAGGPTDLLRLNRFGYLLDMYSNGQFRAESAFFRWTGPGCTGAGYAVGYGQTSLPRIIYAGNNTSFYLYKMGSADEFALPTGNVTVQSGGVPGDCFASPGTVSNATPLTPVTPADLGITASGLPLQVAAPLRLE